MCEDTGEQFATERLLHINNLAKRQDERVEEEEALWIWQACQAIH